MFGFVGTPVALRRASPLPHASRSGRRVAPRAAPTRSCATAAASQVHELDGAQISGPLLPAGHNILVKVAKAAEKTIGGLILSTEAKESPTYGTAEAVGPGRYFPAGGIITMDVKQGDMVMYESYGGTKVKYDGEPHTILTQDDVMCVLEGGEYSAEAVRPIQDRLLVKVDKAAESTKSGIVLASGGSEKPTTGAVAQIGTGRVMENGDIEPMPVSVGEKVLYGQYAGTEVTFGDDTYMFIRVVDIFARWTA